MDFRSDIPLDKIKSPNRSEKLHPPEDEDEEEWEDFRQNIGAEPQKPIEVAEIDDENYDYELIDGDRRLRALRQNADDSDYPDIEGVPAFIRVRGEDIENEGDRLLGMVVANEFRQESNKKQRSRLVAQLIAPYLLPPGDRKDDVPYMTQGDLENQTGIPQPTLTTWLEPMRNEHRLRSVLAKTASGRRVSADDIETIDHVVDLLKRGGDDGEMVIDMGREISTANELAGMDGLNLSELENVAEQAVDDGWNSGQFLEYVRENLAYDEMEQMEDEIDAGYEGDGATDEYTADTGVSTDDVTVDDNGHDDTDFGLEVGEVDWDDLVSDGDLNGRTIGEIEMNERMKNVTIQDEAAVAISVLAAKTGQDERDVVKDFVEPLVTDNAVAYLREN